MQLTLTSNSDGRTAVDAVIQTTPAQDTVEVTRTVELSATTESFAVAVELKNSAGTTVFSGQMGTLTLAASAQPQDKSLSVDYIGIGAEAQSVEITSTDSLVASGDTIALTAVARDGAGDPIANTPIHWMSLNRARATFVAEMPGRLVGGDEPGTVSVVAELLTGPSDMASVRVLMAAPDLVAEAVDSLEAALYIAVTELIDPGPFEVAKLDLFSFESARQLFEQALLVRPNYQTAAFGLAVTSILSLEDDLALRAAADDWDLWLQNNSSIHDLTTKTGDFPPTLVEQQDLLRTIVQPRLLSAIDLLDQVDSANFVFTVTARMQGKNPGEADARELDLTDVIAMRGGLRAAVGGLDIALSLQTIPTPYGPDGFGAALATGSTFGSLTGDAYTRLANARDRILEAVALASEALDSLQAETDDQTDDLVRYDPAAALGWSGFDDYLGAMDVHDARDFLADAEGISQGPATLSMTSGLGEVLGFLMTDLVVDMSRFFLSPVNDYKTLLPEYEVSAGEFHWTALTFDEWLAPDPTLGGVLPNIGSTEELKAAIDLTGAYSDAAYNIDPWTAFTQSPGDGDIFAISLNGNVYEVSADLTTGTERPDVPGTSYWEGSWIARNVATSELVAGPGSQNVLYTRPDDNVSEWTARLNIGDFPSNLVQSPVGGTMFAVLSGIDLIEIAADFSGYATRPYLPQGPVSLMANSQSGELVALSSDGVLYSRPADAASPWVQRLTLPFINYGYYEAIAEAPGGGDMLAVVYTGELYRVSADFSTSVGRPSVPASEVSYLIRNTQTGDLLALTPDGRIFTRPDDAATPWTLRFTLPRTIIP